MILNIFSDIWNKIVEFSDSIYNFVMKNYEQPFFWAIIFGVLLMLGVWAISYFAEK